MIRRDALPTLEARRLTYAGKEIASSLVTLLAAKVGQPSRLASGLGGQPQDDKAGRLTYIGGETPYLRRERNRFQLSYLACDESRPAVPACFRLWGSAPKMIRRDALPTLEAGRLTYA